MWKTYSIDFPVSVSHKRIWWAVIKDAHNCLPKCLPNVIASVEYEGSPIVEVGKVRIIKFHQGSRYVKGRFEEVDEEGLRVKIKILEGGFVGVLFSEYMYTYEFKEEMIRWTVEYKHLSALEKEEEGGASSLEGPKQETLSILRAVEKYLLTNNDYV